MTLLSGPVAGETRRVPLAASRTKGAAADRGAARDDADAVAAWAESHGMSGKSYSEIVSSPEMHEVISHDVDELNAKLNRWETIKKWKLLDRDLSIEDNELTPSMKVKRKVVETNHKDQIDALYKE